MKDLLVGSTGFVGKNLLETHFFSAQCHSKDVVQYYQSKPDLCIYAGVPSAMYVANSNPEKDYSIVKQAMENIRGIGAKKIVLISTVAVYHETKSVDENCLIKIEKLSAYGRNRAILEKWIRKEFPNSTIIRLPALYGNGLKKNFLYDLKTIIPKILTQERYCSLSHINKGIMANYKKRSDGFFELRDNTSKEELYSFFKKSEFNALSFTDSRSIFQFYPLQNLWTDINKILLEDIKTINLVTPPISVRELFYKVTGNYSWENQLTSYYDYDIRTIYAKLFGQKEYYICSKEDEIKGIVYFMKNWKAYN